jgi:hypothetical protein
MSPSDQIPTRGVSTLIASGAPGVEIKIVDTDYRVLARGTDELRLTLPEGVYMVDWMSGGQGSQKVVRLLPVPEPLIVSPDPAVGAGPAEALTAQSSAPEQAIAQTLDEMTRPSEVDYGSDLAVIIRAASPEAKTDLSAGLRLLNGDDVAMRSDGQDAAALQEETDNGYAARLYHVPAGDFRLRYVATTGETLDQTVPVMKDRRTVVFMSAGTGSVLIPDGETFQTVERQGVDPSRTVVVSVPRTALASALAEDARLAEILLHDLAVGRGSLGQAFTDALDAPDADPLLRVYAAAVILTRLDQGASPALDAPWPAEAPEQAAFAARWRARAALWLTSVLQTGAPPDVTPMLWRLQEAGEALAVKPPPLASPPMLDCAWGWAVAQSTRDPKAVPAGVSFRAAGRGTGGTAPWLTWRAASAKGGAPAAKGSKSGDLPAMVDAVASKVADIVNAIPASGSPDRRGDPLDFLSPDAKAMAVRAFEVADPQGLRTTDSAAAGARTDPVTELATLFGTPAPELQARLAQTLAELDDMIGGGGAPPGAVARTAASDPPALMRMVQVPDDPNKGRFGGAAERAGLVLSAAFAPTRNKAWVRVELTVEDRLNEMADGDQADLFLHDSFRPSRIAAVFRKGRASRTVTAWGGFTVGAWIPSRGVELELDLAQQDDAPAIIAER